MKNLNIPIISALWSLAACAMPVASESLQAKSNVSNLAVVTLSPAENGVKASWELEEPVDVFLFNETSMPEYQRAMEWSFDSSEWILDGYTVKRVDGAPFRTFELGVTPPSRFQDRQYVPLAMVGDSGFAIASEVLSPKDMTYSIKFDEFGENSILLANGQEYGVEDSLPGADLGIFYVGPKSFVRGESLKIIAGPEVPNWLLTQLETEVNEAIGTLEVGLKQELDENPTIISTAASGHKTRTFRGSVLGRTIAFYLRGYDLSEIDEKLVQRLSNTTIHETVHLWNGVMFRFNDIVQQPWIHEGSADYIAARLSMTDEEFRAAAQKAFNNCRIALGEEPLLTSQTAKRGRTPYNCGFFIHLISERASLSAGNGNVLDIWAEVFTVANERRNTYDSQVFQSVIYDFGGKAASVPVSRLLDGLSSSQLSEFQAEMAAIGISITPMEADELETTGRDMSGLFLRRLLFGVCVGGHGYWSKEDHLRLNTGDRCGAVLSGNHNLQKLNGYSLVEQGAAVYMSAIQACRSNQPLIFTTLEGRDLDPLDCPENTTTLPDLYELRITSNLPKL